SGGEALEIESTAIAAMAMMSHGRELMPQVRKSIEWLNAHRNGMGGYGSTQSTVLALKAMTQYAKLSRVTEASGTVILRIDGKEVKRVSYAKGHQGAIELLVGEYLHAGKNTIEITLESKEPLPYSGLVTWGSKVPASNPATKVALETKLATQSAKLGEGVRMDVRVTNTTNVGIPMTLARVGLPGGLTFQTWQLQELRDKGIIDFYETRPREVILYFRSLAPKASKDVPLELLASVPGSFTAPASRVYLYYTNEHKAWVAPTTIRVAP
ncbi:MAG: A-macroglobulin complement component, partial [Kofleriaceae bacterium]